MPFPRGGWHAGDYWCLPVMWGSCLPAGQPQPPAPTAEPGWEQSCACYSTERRVEYWGRWGLSLPVCVAVVWSDSKSVLCRACLIARLCCPIPTAGVFAASIQVNDTVQSLRGSFQQGDEAKTLVRFAEIAGVFPLPGTGRSSQVSEGDSDSVSEGHLTAGCRH